jgi:hypothetical protein
MESLMVIEKFQFPSRGFHIVARKVGEADYFLGKLKEVHGYYDEFSYILSAFASAARSITFALQAVMTRYPGFDSWYVSHQEKLKANGLAKYFVNLRNYTQKVGETPISHTGTIRDGKINHVSYFVDIDDLKGAPSGEVTKLAEEYFVEVLKVVEKCYRDFWVYADPRAIFTEEGLALLGWVIEDIEEAVGLPRGYTDIPYHGEDKSFQRLRLLAREFQGDEMMEEYFVKYGLQSTANKALQRTSR